MTEIKKSVYFIRHGQSQANLDRVLAGQNDTPLTKLGVKQAEDAAKDIVSKGVKIDVIISSPLPRAIDTAKIVARDIGYDEEAIVIISELSERRAGKFKGRPFDDLYNASETEVVDGGAETLAQLAQRVRVANEKILARPESVILIVGHAGFYRMADRIAKGESPDMVLEVEELPNATLLDYPL